MADIKIISETPMNLHQLHDELKAIRKRDKELNFRATKTEDYLASMTTLKDHDGLYKKLTSLEIPRLREQHIHKIVELLPTTSQDLKVVLQGYTLNISQDNIKKIAATVAEFTGKG
jgi:DNA-directed RNA polymerase subunit F